MMSRGCRVVGVHFHSQPFTSAASQDAVREVARMLSRYQATMRVASVPLAEVQRHIVSIAPSAFRTVAYRRFMIRIAERIARRVHARALVTGDAVGQVASQTLDNLAVVDAVARMPVLRPLVGFSKEEIIAEARRIGTHEFSVTSEDDCCQLFAPRRVATDATRAEVDAIEAHLDVDALVANAVRAATFESIGPRWETGPVAGTGPHEA